MSWVIVMKSHVGIDNPSYLIIDERVEYGHTKLLKISTKFSTQGEALFAMHQIVDSENRELYTTIEVEDS